MSQVEFEPMTYSECALVGGVIGGLVSTAGTGRTGLVSVTGDSAGEHERGQ